MRHNAELSVSSSVEDEEDKKKKRKVDNQA